MSQGTTKGVPIDIDSTMSANSDALVPSQKAVKTALANAVSIGYKPLYSGKWRTVDFISPPSTLSSINGAIYYVPYIIGKTHNVTDIGIEVTASAAASNIRLALYADNAGNPGNLIEDSGNISSVTTGLKSYTFSSVKTLSDQMCWLALQASSASLVVRGANAIPAFTYITGVGVNGQTPYQIQGFGAFPSTATPLYTGGNNIALICLKIQ